MDIRYKLFPYPVLSNFTDDYEKSGFISEVKVVRDINELVFYFEVLLDNNDLNSLINQNKAEFVFHIECSQTLYRGIIKTSETEKAWRIQESKLNGRVNVCTFIVAKDQIPNYTNICFNKDYEGASFYVERGGILAIANQFNIDITKENEDLSKIPSVFSILRRDSDEDIGMQIEIDGDKIKLWLHDETFNNYKRISNLPAYQPLLHSALILPALIYTFEVLKSSGTEEYEIYRWFRAIEQALKKSDIELNRELLENRHSYDLAQKILSLPISRGLKSIITIGMEEDEE